MKKMLVILGIVAIIAGSAGYLAYKKFGPKSYHITPGGEPASVSAAAPFDLSFCADTLAVEGGTLCASRPSATDERIKDAYDENGSTRDQALGFGYHVVAIPDDWERAKGVWIHFTGTSGRPYTDRRDAYENATWLSELIG